MLASLLEYPVDPDIDFFTLALSSAKLTNERAIHVLSYIQEHARSALLRQLLLLAMTNLSGAPKSAAATGGSAPPRSLYLQNWQQPSSAFGPMMGDGQKFDTPDFPRNYFSCQHIFHPTCQCTKLLQSLQQFLTMNVKMIVLPVVGGVASSSSGLGVHPLAFQSISQILSTLTSVLIDFVTLFLHGAELQVNTSSASHGDCGVFSSILQKGQKGSKAGLSSPQLMMNAGPRGGFSAESPSSPSSPAALLASLVGHTATPLMSATAGAKEATAAGRQSICNILQLLTLVASSPRTFLSQQCFNLPVGTAEAGGGGLETDHNVTVISIEQEQNEIKVAMLQSDYRLDFLCTMIQGTATQCLKEFELTFPGLRSQLMMMTTIQSSSNNYNTSAAAENSVISTMMKIPLLTSDVDSLERLSKIQDQERDSATTTAPSSIQNKFLNTTTKRNEAMLSMLDMLTTAQHLHQHYLTYCSKLMDSSTTSTNTLPLEGTGRKAPTSPGKSGTSSSLSPVSSFRKTTSNLTAGGVRSSTNKTNKLAVASFVTCALVKWKHLVTARRIRLNVTLAKVDCEAQSGSASLPSSWRGGKLVGSPSRSSMPLTVSTGSAQEEFHSEASPSLIGGPVSYQAQQHELTLLRNFRTLFEANLDSILRWKNLDSYLLAEVVQTLFLLTSFEGIGDYLLKKYFLVPESKVPGGARLRWGYHQKGLSVDGRGVEAQQRTIGPSVSNGISVECCAVLHKALHCQWAPASTFVFCDEDEDEILDDIGHEEEGTLNEEEEGQPVVDVPQRPLFARDENGSEDPQRRSNTILQKQQTSASSSLNRSSSPPIFSANLLHLHSYLLLFRAQRSLDSPQAYYTVAEYHSPQRNSDSLMGGYTRYMATKNRKSKPQYCLGYGENGLFGYHLISQIVEGGQKSSKSFKTGYGEPDVTSDDDENTPSTRFSLISKILLERLSNHIVLRPRHRLATLMLGASLLEQTDDFKALLPKSTIPWDSPMHTLLKLMSITRLPITLTKPQLQHIFALFSHWRDRCWQIASIRNLVSLCLAEFVVRYDRLIDDLAAQLLSTCAANVVNVLLDAIILREKTFLPSSLALKGTFHAATANQPSISKGNASHSSGGAQDEGKESHSSSSKSLPGKEKRDEGEGIVSVVHEGEEEQKDTTKSKQASKSATGVRGKGTNTRSTSCNSKATTATVVSPHSQILGKLCSIVLLNHSPPQILKVMPVLHRMFNDPFVPGKLLLLEHLSARISEFDNTWYVGNLLLTCLRNCLVTELKSVVAELHGKGVHLFPQDAQQRFGENTNTSATGITMSTSSPPSSNRSQTKSSVKKGGRGEKQSSSSLDGLGLQGGDHDDDEEDVHLPSSSLYDTDVTNRYTALLLSARTFLTSILREQSNVAIAEHARLVQDLISHMPIEVVIDVLSVSNDDLDEVGRYCEQREGSTIPSVPVVPVDIKLDPINIDKAPSTTLEGNRKAGVTREFVSLNFTIQRKLPGGSLMSSPGKRNVSSSTGALNPPSSSSPMQQPHHLGRSVCGSLVHFYNVHPKETTRATMQHHLVGSCPITLLNDEFPSMNFNLLLDPIEGAAPFQLWYALYPPGHAPILCEAPIDIGLEYLISNVEMFTEKTKEEKEEDNLGLDAETIELCSQETIDTLIQFVKNRRGEEKGIGCPIITDYPPCPIITDHPPCPIITDHPPCRLRFSFQFKPSGQKLLLEAQHEELLESTKVEHKTEEKKDKEWEREKAVAQKPSGPNDDNDSIPSFPDDDREEDEERSAEGGKDEQQMTEDAQKEKKTHRNHTARQEQNENPKDDEDEKTKRKNARKTCMMRMKATDWNLLMYFDEFLNKLEAQQQE